MRQSNAVWSERGVSRSEKPMLKVRGENVSKRMGSRLTTETTVWSTLRVPNSTCDGKRGGQSRAVPGDGSLSLSSEVRPHDRRGRRIEMQLVRGSRLHSRGRTLDIVFQSAAWRKNRVPSAGVDVVLLASSLFHIGANTQNQICKASCI